MNLIIIILTILLILAILYIFYIKFYNNNDNKKVRFSNINQEKEFNKKDIINNKNNYDEMSFLEPDYEKRRLDELKFDLI